jgi:hypothetical protein
MGSLGYDSPHVSPIDDKGDCGPRGEARAHEDHDGEDSFEGERISGVQSVGGPEVNDETERTRLIGAIMRLMREPSLPEATRHAGMTLVGWLARRRLEEAPHSIGIDEARESERRIRAARVKTRP